MKFEISNEGRVINCLPEEIHCSACKKNKGEWYFYDHPSYRTLFCRVCAVKGKYLINQKGKYVFWKVDKFKYGGKNDLTIKEDL